jgi:hypothetical protein
MKRRTPSRKSAYDSQMRSVSGVVRTNAPSFADPFRRDRGSLSRSEGPTAVTDGKRPFSAPTPSLAWLLMLIMLASRYLIAVNCWPVSRAPRAQPLSRSYFCALMAAHRDRPFGPLQLIFTGKHWTRGDVTADHATNCLSSRRGRPKCIVHCFGRDEFYRQT